MAGQRKYLAGNPNPPPQTLTILATDEDEEIRQLVAKNPNTSPETLVMLANIL